MTRTELGERIAGAREREGWSQEQLAREVGITQSAMSRIESGDRGVDSLELAKVAKALRVSVLDLLAEDPARTGLLIAARAESAASPAALDVALGVVQELMSTDQLLDNLGVDKGAIPALRPPTATTDAPVDVGRELAEWLRAKLGFGDDPILDIVEVAERRAGLDIALFPLPDGIAGLCVHADSVSLALVDSNPVIGRQRFTIAHELCHHLVNDPRPVHIDENLFRRSAVEIRANAFAAHLLMPAAGIRRHIGDVRATERQVIELQYAFGVSLEALCWHLVNLGVISKERRAKLVGIGPKVLAFRHGFIADWRNADSHRREIRAPLRILRRALIAYTDGQIAVERIARLLGTSDTEKLRRELEEVGISPGGWPGDTAPA